MAISAVRQGLTGRADLAVAVRERWRRASLEAGWAFPRDWWVPAVDAVVETVLARRSPEAAGLSLGVARAEAGVGIAEALDDVRLLARIVADLPEFAGSGSRPDPVLLVRGVAVGWAEHSCVPDADSVCEDPLTRLVTPAYLRTRLAETYRQAERAGESVSKRFALVVVAADPVPVNGRSRDTATGAPEQRLARLVEPGAEWDHVVRLVLVAEALRATFSGGETLASLGRNTAVALVERDELLGRRAGVLRELVERERLANPRDLHSAIGVWIEGLPTTLSAAISLIDELRR